MLRIWTSKRNEEKLNVKGQYLIFEDGIVFNIRGNEGYYVGMELE
mgnify:CR=1 FL=1